MPSILETIKQREVLGLSGRFNMVFANASFRAAQIVPTRYRWIVTDVVQRISLPTPEFPEVKDEVLRILNTEETLATEPEVELLTPPLPLYTAYRCLHNNPLHCEWPAQTLEENPDAKTCLRCGFPTILPPEKRIQGKRGRYQIEGLLRTRNLGRLYRAIDLLDRQPVLVKEYLLPLRHFKHNPIELQQRQRIFDHFTSLELADRRTPDLRWDIPLDAVVELIANEQQQLQSGRAYSILPEIPESFPTLGQYLQETGPLSPYLVRQILLQVLQSLEGLHEQKYRLPTGIVHTELCHGNLNLESLLIVPNFQGFYIYLTDPALWEHLFLPPNQTAPEPSVAGDLNDLGQVAFYLLAGRSADPGNQTPLDPGVPDYWPDSTPEALRRYVLSLVGLNNLPFASASLARQALLKLPIAEPVIVVAAPEAEAEAKKARQLLPRWLWILLALLLGAGVLGLIIWFLNRLNAQRQSPEPPTICCVSQIAGLPKETIYFTGEGAGVWTPIWQQENLIIKDRSLAGEIDRRLNPDSPAPENPAADASSTDEPTAENPVTNDPATDDSATESLTSESPVAANPVAENLGATNETATDATDPAPDTAATEANGEETTDPDPDADPETDPDAEAEPPERTTLTYLPQPSASEVFAKVRSQEAAFAISSLLENLGIDLWYEEFAYDAIAVYVAFSYEDRRNGLPRALKGQISFAQLRQLYTGEISNWQELGGPDLPVRLYIPADQEAVTIFEQRVLQTEAAIARFRELRDRRTSASAASTQITQLTTFQTLNAVLRDFEVAQVGAIAFGSLSEVFGQCSVYPLALKADPNGTGTKGSVSPLVNNWGLPISPQIDLCNEKGSYATHIAAIREQRYPLAYPLAVVYPLDNRRPPLGQAFAALLQTDEGQLLLQKAGLVPLREIDEKKLEQTLEGESNE